MKRRLGGRSNTSRKLDTTSHPTHKKNTVKSIIGKNQVFLLLVLLLLAAIVYLLIPTRYSGPKHANRRSDEGKKAAKQNTNNPDADAGAGGRDQGDKDVKKSGNGGGPAGDGEDGFTHSGISCEKLMEDAKMLIETRPKTEWEEALDLLATCALQEPENSAPRWNLAVTLLKMNRVNEALNFIDEALSLDPNNVGYLKDAGSFLTQMGMHDEAIRCIEGYLEVSLRVPSWEQLLASISVQREDEWMFLYDAGQDIVNTLEKLQASYLHEMSLIKAGYLYKIIIGLKGEEVELKQLASYSFFAFGLGDLSTGIKYLRLYTERQYIQEGYGNVNQAYEVVTAHSLRLFTAGFDSHLISIGKNLLMGGNLVWDELVYNCELKDEILLLNYTVLVKQADLRHVFVQCVLVQNVINALLDEGAVVYAENMFGWTPLLNAASLGSAEIVNQLMKHHADPQVSTVLAHTSLHIAAMRGSYDIVLPLTQAGLKPKEIDYFNRSALQVACLHGWSAQGMADALKVELPHGCPSKPLYSPPSKLNPQGGWLPSSITLPKELTTERCDFDILSISDVQTFVFEYLALQRPVLIRNATSIHQMKKLHQLWLRSKFEQEYGSLSFNEVEVPYAESFGYSSTYRTSVKSFMSKMKAISHEHEDKHGVTVESLPPPTYIFETISPDSPLLREFILPAILDPEVTHINPLKTRFYIGPPLSGAPVHFHRSAWNLLVYGQKRWFLYPPDRAFYSKQHVWDWWRHSYSKSPDALECVQYPGDMIFVPDMWGHAVINLREGVGLASEFMYGASEFSI